MHNVLVLGRFVKTTMTVVMNDKLERKIIAEANLSCRYILVINICLNDRNADMLRGILSIGYGKFNDNVLVN